jgi:rhodanese-related sulfurtransferase
VQILALAPALAARTAPDPTTPLPPRLLSALAIKHASVASFEEIPDPRAGERSSSRVFCSESHDIWLIRWGAGYGRDECALLLTALGDHAAVRLLIRLGAAHDPTRGHRPVRIRVRMKPRSVDELVDAARASLQRVTPIEARDAARNGALLVDTRPQELRARDGTIPGALVIDRNVLEWRLDPTSPHRTPEITSHDQQVILFCDEGWASSLAARSLQELGLRNATDLVGGIQAWKAAGLPIDAPA